MQTDELVEAVADMLRNGDYLSPKQAARAIIPLVLERGRHMERDAVIAYLDRLASDEPYQVPAHNQIRRAALAGPIITIQRGQHVQTGDQIAAAIRQVQP